MQSCERKMQQMKDDCHTYGVCLARLRLLEEKMQRGGESAKLRKEKRRLEKALARTEALLDEVEENCGGRMRDLLLRVLCLKQKPDEVARELDLDESTMAFAIDTCLFEVVVDHLHMKGENTYA